MLDDQHVVHKGSKREHHYEEIENNWDENPLLDIYNRAQHKYHYRAEETGIYHPQMKQVLKLRNNGAIDLFASKETGFRIDPNNENVHLFANHFKEHLDHMTSWLTGNEERYAKGHRFLKTGGKTTILSKQDMKLITEKNLLIQVDGDEQVIIHGDVNLEVYGNMNAKIHGHATMKLDGNLDVRSDQNITMIADGYVHIDGTKLYLGRNPE